MIIECLIKRDGPTEFNHAGMKYIFMPRPEITGGDKEASVCEVCADHAIKRLTDLKSMYREYKPREVEPVHVATPKKKTAKPFTKEEFSILTDEGQVRDVINKCIDKELIYAIGAAEHASKTRRQWVIELLEGRLKVLETIL